MISHAVVGLAAVSALPVATIQPSLQTLLVAAIGTALLVQAGLAAAVRATVAMAAVTVLANPDRAVAFAAAPLPQNNFLSRHAYPRAALDNGRESRQVRTECW